MKNSLSVQGSANLNIWFVVDNKTGEKIAKCNSVVEAVKWANSYIDRKENKQ